MQDGLRVFICTSILGRCHQHWPVAMLVWGHGGRTGVEAEHLNSISSFYHLNSAQHSLFI